MKKGLAFVLLLTLSCHGAPRKGQVTILHTNDMHAQFVPAPATWVQQTPRPLIGGMVALDYYVREQRILYPNSLLLDAGDISTGTLLSKISYNGVLNGGFVEMMNLIGYDAVAIGNHEFDEGQENMRHMFSMAQFDVLSANLTVDGKAAAPLPYKIYSVDGLRVGVIGLVLSDLYSMVAEKNLVGVRVADPVETAQRLIDDIDDKTDLIVLLTHQGDDQDILLAQKIHGADIIVGGHSHTLLKEPILENGLIIVQTGSKCRSLGSLTVEVKGDTISSFDYNLINLWADNVKSPDPKMTALVQQFQQQIDAEYGRQIGVLKTDWKSTDNEESNIGNFITDVMRKETGSDAAFMNSGGIRKSLPAGPIKRSDIMEILPFSNYVVTFELTGDQLIRLIEKDVRDHVQKGSSLYQISGLSYMFRQGKNKEGELLEARIQGALINPAKTYRGVTVDFVMDKWRQNFVFQNVRQTADLISDVVVQYIEKNPEITSTIDGRIRRVE